MSDLNLSDEYRKLREMIAAEVAVSSPTLQGEFHRLWNIQELVFAHSIRRGATGKPMCTLSSGPESVQCGECVFCYIRALETVLDPAKIIASIPDGYTLEVHSEEKKKKIAQDRVRHHKATRDLRAAVRAIEQHGH